MPHQTKKLHRLKMLKKIVLHPDRPNGFPNTLISHINKHYLLHLSSEISSCSRFQPVGGSTVLQLRCKGNARLEILVVDKSAIQESCELSGAGGIFQTSGVHLLLLALVLITTAATRCIVATATPSSASCDGVPENVADHGSCGNSRSCCCSLLQKSRLLRRRRGRRSSSRTTSTEPTA